MYNSSQQETNMTAPSGPHSQYNHPSMSYFPPPPASNPISESDTIQKGFRFVQKRVDKFLPWNKAQNTKSSSLGSGQGQPALVNSQDLQPGQPSSQVNQVPPQHWQSTQPGPQYPQAPQYSHYVQQPQQPKQSQAPQQLQQPQTSQQLQQTQAPQQLQQPRQTQHHQYSASAQQLQQPQYPQQPQYQHLPNTQQPQQSHQPVQFQPPTQPQQPTQSAQPQNLQHSQHIQKPHQPWYQPASRAPANHATAMQHHGPSSLNEQGHQRPQRQAGPTTQPHIVPSQPHPTPSIMSKIGHSKKVLKYAKIGLGVTAGAVIGSELGFFDGSDDSTDNTGASDSVLTNDTGVDAYNGSQDDQYLEANQQIPGYDYVAPQVVGYDAYSSDAGYQNTYSYGDTDHQETYSDPGSGYDAAQQAVGYDSGYDNGAVQNTQSNQSSGYVNEGQLNTGEAASHTSGHSSSAYAAQQSLDRFRHQALQAQRARISMQANLQTSSMSPII